MWPDTPPKKFVIWGLELYSHTHAYIHYAFQKAALHLGWDAEWVSDTPENSSKFTDCDDYLFLAINVADSHIPIRKNAYYILHNCDNVKYRRIPDSHILMLQVYTDKCLQQNPIQLKKYHYWNPTLNTLYMPWATDLLPHEIEVNKQRVLADSIPGQDPGLFLGTAYYGSIHSNMEQIGPFQDACRANNVPFQILNSTSISNEESIRLLQNARFTPTIVGHWQKDQGYIPCRIFKTFSYGQLGITNSKQAADIIGLEHVLFNPNEYELGNQACAVEAETRKMMTLRAMDIVKNEHTYLNRIQTLQDMFKKKTAYTTVVTAYYPLHKSKHSIDKYREWYINFFECVSADVVCFCPPELKPDLDALAKPNHTIIARDFDSFEMMSPKYMQIWNECYTHDIERYHSPELYAIWAAKQEFVNEAMKLVDSSVYVWCDIGCFRTKREANFAATPNHIVPSKITCLYLKDIEHPTGRSDTIGGGVLAGDKYAWNNFSQLYIESLNKDPHGKDQVVYMRILNESNAIFIHPPSNADIWFYLTYLFSSSYTNNIYTPTNVSKYNICDVFYRDIGGLAIVTNSDVILDISIVDTPYTFTHYTTYGNHSITYICDTPKKHPFVDLSINGERIRVHVNTYPTFKDENIMSTQVFKEDAYIIRWIEYYKRLGVTRFIVYDNWKGLDSNLPDILSAYILTKEVVLISWPYVFDLGGQVAQQTHSVHAFRSSKYIGLFDIDEYVNLQSNYLKIEDVLTLVNNDNSKNIKFMNYHPDYQNNHFVVTNTQSEIGGYRFLCRRFFNDNKPTNDYEFFKAYNCLDFDMHGREKFFINPRNVNTFAVHAITDGKPMVTVPLEVAYFNHYIFLNKHFVHEGNCYANILNRGNLTSDNAHDIKHIDSSIMRFYKPCNKPREYIGCVLQGGLGNNLFQLAFIDYIATNTGRQQYVEYYKSKHTDINYLTTIFKNIQLLQEPADLRKDWVFEEEKYSEPEDWLRIITTPNVMMKGYFQDYKYILPSFKEKLLFNTSVISKHPDIAQKVFIHIRGGDYSNHWLHGLCMNNYYTRAILSFEPGTEFAVFTDDVICATGVLSNLNINIKHTLIDENEIDSLYLMSQCKGGICANSSFSWWGAYLNPNRKLVLPSKWYTDPAYYIKGYHFPGCTLMSDISDAFVDKIVYINLDRRQDRRQHVERITEQFDNVIRFPAIGTTPGWIGCAMSHIAVLQMATHNNWNNVLILEDDANWNSYDEGYAKFEKLATAPYDVIMLGAAYSTIDPQTSRITSGSTTTAYLVNNHYFKTLSSNFAQALQKLIETGDKQTYSIDQWWKQLQARDNWYCVNPCLMLPIPGHSDIDSQFSDQREHFNT